MLDIKVSYTYVIRINGQGTPSGWPRGGTLDCLVSWVVFVGRRMTI